MKIKKTAKLLIIILLPIFLQSFAWQRNQRRAVKGIFIDHQTQDLYITEEAIKKMILKDPQAINPIGLIDLKEIEQTLDSHQMIEKSEVFYTIDGIINAKITQRKPIARIFQGDKFIYMDRLGNEMPLSANFSARVPLVFGYLNKENWETAYQFLSFIEQDDFLAKNITEIYITKTNEYEFKMRVPNFRVIFGKFEDETLKTANLKAFYKQLEKTKKLDDYKIVNLKFSNQVVCKK